MGSTGGERKHDETHKRYNEGAHATPFHELGLIGVASTLRPNSL